MQIWAFSCFRIADVIFGKWHGQNEERDTCAPSLPGQLTCPQHVEGGMNNGKVDYGECKCQNELSSRPERTRISCHAAPERTANAPLRKERRMKIAEATKFHRKSGGAEWRTCGSLDEHPTHPEAHCCSLKRRSTAN
jgi:hypothetical protein